METKQLTFEQRLADALQRVLAPIEIDDGDSKGEGVLLQNYVVVSDWETAEGKRGVHIAWGENQPEYITKALLNEGLGMLDEDDEDDD